MLSTSLRSQTIVRCTANSTGDVDVTAQTFNEYYQDEHPKPLVRIAKTDKGFSVTVLAENITVQQFEKATA